MRFLPACTAKANSHMDDLDPGPEGFVCYGCIEEDPAPFADEFVDEFDYGEYFARKEINQMLANFKLVFGKEF